MTVSLFDANYYRAANADLAKFNDAQALAHFQSNGLNEGRAFSTFVNLNFYRSSNSDLSRFNNKQLFDHLQNNGVREGRRFSEFVDLNLYKSSNRDLARFNNEQAFGHLQTLGVAEGRRFSVFVDLNFYQAANPDLKKVGFNNKQLLDHLTINGVNEGRRYSVSFDSNYYRNTYSDLAKAGLNHRQLIQHFELNGLKEGRASSESFDVKYYLTNNADLRKAGLNNQQAHQHFELFGLREGRQGAPSGSVPVPTDPGTSLGGAFNLGVVSTSRSVSESVGTTDRDDYYRFTLANTSNFNLSLSGLSGSTKVELIYDSNNNGQVDSSDLLRQASGGINNNASISSALGAGSYFMRVNAATETSNTNYNLAVSATVTSPTTPRDPGNTLSTALNIGTVGSNLKFSEFIGSVDSNDYYRFNLASTSKVNLSVKDLSDNASVQLIFDNNGNGLVDSSDIVRQNDRNSNEDVFLGPALGAGTYFIRVSTPYGSVNTNYTLGVSATATPPTTPRDPGNTLSTALDIGALSTSRSFTDFIGSVDRNDYYRFTLASTSTFSLSLDNLKDNVRAELLVDKNSNGQYDAGERLYDTPGNEFSPGSIIAKLGPGNYFVRVNTSSPADNTNYTLSMSAV